MLLPIPHKPCFGRCKPLMCTLYRKSKLSCCFCFSANTLRHIQARGRGGASKRTCFWRPQQNINKAWSQSVCLRRILVNIISNVTTPMIEPCVVHLQEGIMSHSNRFLGGAGGGGSWLWLFQQASHKHGPILHPTNVQTGQRSGT